MRSICIGFAVVLLAACPGSSGTPSGDPTDEDTEANTGVDTDVDSSADTEADSDSEADSEVDTDADTSDGTFACGELTCSADQFCHIGYGGAAPPPGESNISYSCNAIPDECLSELTCDCLYAEGACYQGAGDCRETGAHLECSTYYP